MPLNPEFTVLVQIECCRCGKSAPLFAPAGPAWIRLLKEAPPVRLRPRGLMNTGNSCFLNSTLQALFACPPFLLLVNQLKTSPIDPVRIRLSALKNAFKLSRMDAFENLLPPVTCNHHQ
jgi:ubiquitin C-terminal hydrolase